MSSAAPHQATAEHASTAEHHPAPGAPTQAPADLGQLPPLDSSVDLDAMDPSATLEPDPIDSPSPLSVEEALKKDAGDSGHPAGHGGGDHGASHHGSTAPSTPERSSNPASGDSR